MNAKTLEYEDIYTIADDLRIPMSVTIELCTTCNMRCKHCYIPKHSNIGLSHDELISILKQIRKLGTFELVLTGGEIFCRDDIMEIISAARSMGFELILFSNASMITEKIAKSLGEMYIFNFSTSIYSLDDSIHDGITGIPGSLQATLRGVSYLKKYNVPIQVKTMVMGSNVDSIEDLIIYCRKNGFQYLVSPFLFPCSDGNSNPTSLRLNYDQLKKVMPLVDHAVKFSPQTKSEEDYMCSSIRHSLGIDASGNVSPCNAMFYPVGNLRTQSVEEVWNSNKLIEIQNLRRSDLPQCKNCENSAYCIRCAGTALLEKNDMLAKYDYACVIAEIRRLQHTCLSER